MSVGRGVLAGAAVIVAAQLALYGAVFTPAPHTGGDNTAYLTLAFALTQGLGYVELWDPDVLPHTKYPPVYPALLGGLMLLGATGWAAFKVLSAVLLAAAGVLVFAWAGGRRGALFGAAATGLVVFAGGWVDASRWILSEPAFLGFVLLALWAADRAGLVGPGPPEGEAARARPPALGEPAPARRAGTGEAAPAGPPGGAGRWWLALAAAAALLAFLTRTAGLPVVLALFGALLVARRLGWAAGVGSVTAAVTGLWALRARRGGEGAYQSEFWMVNPYEPEMGTIGIGGLLGRVAANLWTYVGRVLPGEWWNGMEGMLPLLGLALAGAALAGWGLRLRERRLGMAELFFPLYGGMILVWPEVWTGDRFLLPLIPLLVFYAGEAVVRGAARAGAWAPAPAGALAFLLLALPAVPGVLATAEEAAACRRIGAADPFLCHGPGVREFRAAAAWAGVSLPEGAVTFTRKPRIFYALGGTRSRSYPFTRDPDAFLAEADRIGAGYLLVDRWDGISRAYLPAVIRGRPGAFCWLAEWGEGTDLLGILPAETGRDGELEICPEGYLVARPGEPPPPGRDVPLLAAGGAGLRGPR